MKRLFLAALALLLCHAVAFGQGYIGIFADPQGTNCEIEEAYPGVMQVYVVHVDAPEGSASDFAVVAGPGFTGVYLGDILAAPNGLAVGNAPTGVAVGYGECLQSPIHILTISYYVSGTSDPCSSLEVVPGNDPNGIVSVDCSGNLVVLEVGGKANFNVSQVSEGSCNCADPLSPLADELTTWGHVKAMFE
jgi:hypothetical protein